MLAIACTQQLAFDRLWHLGTLEFDANHLHVIRLQSRTSLANPLQTLSKSNTFIAAGYRYTGLPPPHPRRGVDSTARSCVYRSVRRTLELRAFWHRFE